MKDEQLQEEETDQVTENLDEDKTPEPNAVISIAGVLYDDDTYRVFINDPMKTSSSIVALEGLVNKIRDHLSQLTSETHNGTTNRLAALEQKLDVLTESHAKTLEVIKPLVDVVTGMFSLREPDKAETEE